MKHCQALLYVSTGEFWSLTLTVSKAYPLRGVDVSTTDVHEGKWQRAHWAWHSMKALHSKCNTPQDVGAASKSARSIVNAPVDELCGHVLERPDRPLPDSLD